MLKTTQYMKKKRGKTQKFCLWAVKSWATLLSRRHPLHGESHLLQRIKSKHSFRLLISQESLRETCIKQKQCQPLIFRRPRSLSYSRRIPCPVTQTDVSLGACVGSTFKMLFRRRVHAGIDHLCKSMRVGILSTACVCKERVWRCKWHRHFIGYTRRIASSIPGSNFNNSSKDYRVSDPRAE